MTKTLPAMPVSASKSEPKIREIIAVSGGAPLRGEIAVSGSKNSSLPILTAALLAAKGECVLHNVPDISDANLMCEMLESLGARVRREGDAVVIDASDLNTHVAPDGLVRAMRASFYVAAPLLARLRKAEVPLPGGCVLGPRPVNYHIDAFTAMGARDRHRTRRHDRPRAALGKAPRFISNPKIPASARPSTS